MRSEEKRGLRLAQASRWVELLLAAFAALLASAPAAAQTFPQLTGRVVDQANIIPDDREAAMAQRLEQLQRATSRQLVVATVSSLEDQPIEDYANRLFREWRLGQSEANNGVLLLVAPNERRVRIEVGYGLEGILTDAFTGQVIRDHVIPRFRENDYPGGIEAGTNALIIQLAAPAEAAEQRAIEAERERYGAGNGDGGGEAAFIIIGILVILGIPVLLAVIEAVGGRRRRRVSPWGQAYGRRDGDDGGLGWVVAGALLEAFLSGRGGGGGSWGGGSSWGGGGGFSGGGGSSGGGGASGSW